jgi:hypothetical protein
LDSRFGVYPPCSSRNMKLAHPSALRRLSLIGSFSVALTCSRPMVQRWQQLFPARAASTVDDS